ncbi:calcium-binding protein, partial [Planktomarina temperata]|nr:calcium-binding protein [Planktomarina temperata]
VTGGSGSDDINMASVVTAREISVSAGAGDDTITTGAVLFVDSGATIAGDVVDGGTGTDILSVTAAAANSQTAVTTISGIEELTISDALVTGGITVANYQAGINTVNLAAGGIGEITFEAGANTVNLIAPLAAGTLALTDTGTATTDSVTIVNEDEAADAFADRAITSTGFETVNLVTTGLATAGGTNTATAQDIGAVTVTVDTGGTAVVNVSGTNIANINGTVTAHTLNFSGLTAQAAGTATADMTGVAFEYVGATGSGTITGSAGDDVLVGDTGESTNITGGLGDDTITGGSAAETISGGAGADTINGGGGADTINGDAGDDGITLGGGTESVDAGAGDDTVTAAANLTFGTTIVGGAGTDILSTNVAVTASNGSVVSGFETLTFATAGTTDLDNFGNNTFTTVTSGALGAQTIQSVRAEVITLTGIATGTVTVTMEDATGTADTVALAVSGDADLTQTLDFVVADVETVNLTSTDTDDTTAHAHTVFIDADSATTLNVSGNTAVTIAAGSGDLLDVITMDASGLVLAAVTDAGITYVSDYTVVGGVSTITGSNGVDSLTGNVNTNDTISGGAGVDTLVYVGGADTFTGGAGNDVFDINLVGTSASHLTIADLTAGDTIEIAGIDTGTATWNTTEVTLGSAATLANYLDAASAGDGSANSILRWFEFGGDTYLVNDNTAGATFAATDAVIEITGSFDLTDSTLATTVLTIV